MGAMARSGACPGWVEGPLSRVALPGSHDSGAYALPGPLAGGKVPAEVQAAYEALRRVAPGDAESLDAVVRRWGVTQRSEDFDVAAQLGAGVRFLDLRACLDGQGVWRGCHALFGPPFADLLGDVERFLDAHREEAVVLEVAVVGGVPAAASGSPRHALAEEIMGALAGHVFPGCATASAAACLAPSLATLVSSGRRCLVLMDPPPEGEGDWPFWPVREHVVNTWPDVGEVAAMVRFNREAVAQYGRLADEGVADRAFFKLTFVLTATAHAVVEGALRPGDADVPHSLVDLADLANAAYGAFADDVLRDVDLGGVVLFDNVHPLPDDVDGRPHPVVQKLLELLARRHCSSISGNSSSGSSSSSSSRAAAAAAA